MDPEPQEECARCAGHLGWIDEAWVCPSGCTHCADCRDEMGGACASCSEILRRRERRTQALPGRRPVPQGTEPAIGDSPAPHTKNGQHR